MAATVLTTAQWNALLDKVNTATQNCGGGNLQHVTDPHLWSLQDITAVQNVLKAGCSTATFTTPAGPPYIWMQKIIDEINAALSVACCNGPTGPSGASGPTNPCIGQAWVYEATPTCTSDPPGYCGPSAFSSTTLYTSEGAAAAAASAAEAAATAYWKSTLPTIAFTITWSTALGCTGHYANGSGYCACN